MARTYPESKIVEAVYQKTKDAGEHPSEKLRRIANRIEEEFSEELEHSAKLQALHSMLIAQSIRAEDHEGRMVFGKHTRAPVVDQASAQSHRYAPGKLFG